MESETEASSLSSQSSAISELFEEDVSALENGSGDYGCSHYRRRCKIRAPCCNEIFDCRHCHNEAKNSMETDPLDQHDLPRHEVEQFFDERTACAVDMRNGHFESEVVCYVPGSGAIVVGLALRLSPVKESMGKINDSLELKVICSQCGTEQDVKQYCTSCGICMGKYFCTTCKFFDDDTSKNQFHCDECGICRIGGKENFFHCNKCECCHSKSMEDGHQCIERAMHHNCPVCFEFLFDSMKAITVLQCGHTIHDECMEEMMQHFRYSCPICSKSIGDMSGAWAKLDEVIASTPMPEIYSNKMVWILCNDCGANSNVRFHIMAHKCLSCNSYNTRQIQGEPPAQCASRVAEAMSCHTG